MFFPKWEGNEHFRSFLGLIKMRDVQWGRGWDVSFGWEGGVTVRRA